jgi:hypothetical protein
MSARGRSSILVAFAAVVLASACARPRPRPADVVIVTPPSREDGGTVAKLADAGPPALDPCAVARSRIEARRVAPLPEGGSPRLPYGRCWAGPRGAWVLTPGKRADGGDETTWVAVHVDSRGDVAERERSFLATPGHDSAEDPSVPPFGRIDHAWAEAFDFDGDGDPELFVGLHGIWSSATGLELAESVLYTFHEGAVVPYPPAAALGIWRLEDRDGDGRPDIVTSSPYARSRGGSTPVFSPLLVAHSLAKGTFSTTDAVAERAARLACPKRPLLTTLRLPAPPHREDDEVRLACARMWGTPLEDIAQKLHAKPGDADWPDVLRVAPPLTLRP